MKISGLTYSRFVKHFVAIMALFGTAIVFQNCSEGFKVNPENSLSSSSTAGASCLLSDGTVVQHNQSFSGYPSATGMPLSLCGARVSGTCSNGVMQGLSGGPAPMYSTCTQYCTHPDTGQLVAAGSAQGVFNVPSYYTIASANTQAECTAAQRPAFTSMCSSDTGMFSPAVPAQATRYMNCTVSGAPAMCVYPAGSDYVQPATLTPGSIVTGLTANTQLYPNLCSSATLTVTRTCGANGQWNDTVPLYRACTQQCVNPKNSTPINAFTGDRSMISTLPSTTTGLYTYYTVQQGTSAECSAAKKVAYCDQPSGQLLDSISNTGISTPVAQQYATCSVIAAPTITTFTVSATGVPAAAAITVTSGTMITLSWAITGAPTALSISDGTTNTDVMGRTTQTFTPTATATRTITYTLTATNAAGSNTRTVTVTVNPPAAPTWIVNPAPTFVVGSTGAAGEFDLKTSLQAAGVTIVAGGVFSCERPAGTADPGCTRSLPAGMTLNANTGIITLGTAAVGDTADVIFVYTTP